MAGVDDLRAKMRIAAERVIARMHLAMPVMLAVRGHFIAHARKAHAKEHHHKPGPPEFMADAQAELLQQLTELFEPHARPARRSPGDRRPRPPQPDLRIVRGPSSAPKPSLTPDQIADLDARRHLSGRTPDAAAADPHLPRAVRPVAHAGRGPAVRGHRRHAVPAEPERRHHRPGRHPGRHPLHPPRRWRDAPRVAAPDRLLHRGGLVRVADGDGRRPRPARRHLPPGRFVLGPRDGPASARPR